jgi:hypothetical protein
MCYKQYCRILTRVISAAKRAHYNRMILKSNNKVKSTWRIINEEKGNIKRNKGIHSIMIGKKVITIQEKIATAFNKYFLSIADYIIPENNNHTNLGIANPINYLVKTFSRPFNKINWKYATSYEIEKIIRSLKTKNTSRYDEIANRIIKSSSEYIISPLAHICNVILNTGIFPERLKFARLNQYLKKGNPTRYQIIDTYPC